MKSASKKHIGLWITISLLIVVLTGVSWFAWTQYKEVNKRDNAKAKVAEAVQSEAKILARKVDAQGLQHVTIEAAQNVLPHAMLKEAAVSPGILDTTAMAIGIQKKQILELTQISTTAQARALRAERKLDSLQRITYYYKDKYLQVSYRPASVSADTADKGQFDFTYNDSLNVVQYWKRKWLLGAKKSYIDIYSNDPRTTVNGVKRLVVEQKQPAFGLRVQAVSNYSFSRKLMNVGPGIQFDFNRWSLVGTYYYDLDAMQWRPSMGVRYDLVRF